MAESTSERERQIEEAIAWYYQQAEAGGPFDRNVFLARYPQLQGDLESFLADKAAFDQAAGGAELSATVSLLTDPRAIIAQPEAGIAASGSLGTVRYFGD